MSMKVISESLWLPVIDVKDFNWSVSVGVCEPGAGHKRNIRVTQHNIKAIRSGYTYSDRD